MASWGRAHVIKAALLVSVILLILLNFYNFRLDSRLKFDSPTSISIIHPSSSAIKWPKRIRINSGKLNANSTDVTKGNDNNINKINRSATTINIFHPIISSNSIRNDNNKHSSISRLNLSAQNDMHDNSLSNPQPHSEILQNATILAETETNSNRTINNSIKRDDMLSLSKEQQSLKLETSSTKQFLQKLMTTFGLNSCPPIPPNLKGPIDVNTDYEKLSVIEEQFRDKLLPGGWYKPTECNAKDRVAIVIPYRDRANHLPVFLKNIHPFLMKQQIEYGIFIVEQITDGLFNRAALMNVGFIEALKLNDWDCFIFHDIDLIPMDDRNLYTCPDQPRHMSVAVDTMGFKLPYSSIFGGVSAMSVKQFKTVNGFSNAFWGWGGEDDDMSNRLKHVGYHIARYPVNIARYTMLNHRKEKANPRRYEKLVNGVKKFDTEGLNSLKYKIYYLERKTLYTWILVEIKQDSSGS